MKLSNLLAALVCAWPLLPAQAGRPLATEDAGVLARGECEWESFAARASERQGSALRTLSTQIGCGVGARSQLALAVQRESSDGQAASALALGGKTGLVEARDGLPALSLAWSAAALKPPGESMRYDQTALALVLSQTLARDLTGHANLGWARSRIADSSTTRWNLAAEYTLGRGVDVMAEVYGERHDKPWVGAGLRFAASETLSFDTSLARHAGAARGKLWTIGAKLGF